MTIHRRNPRRARRSILTLETCEARLLMATAPPLGMATGFAVLGSSTVTSTGATNVVGDVGVSPGTSITGLTAGQVTGTIYAGGPVAAQAEADANTAYDVLAAEPVDTILSGQDLGGMTLTPGVYQYGSSAQLSGALTFDAQGNSNAIFVIQIGSTLMTTSESSVTLIGDARENNIFWQVGSSATIGTGTAFQGNLIASASITLTTGATLDNGRALALNGAVTMDTNSISNAFTSPLTITADDQTSVYGAPLMPLTASYNGFTDGDTSASLTTLPTLSTNASASSPVGTYNIFASNAVDQNYTFSYIVGTYTITPATLTITADGQTKVYGAALPTLTASYSGFVNDETFFDLTTLPTLSTTATTSSPVGTYSITAIGAVDSNYTFNYVTGSLDVTPASLTITADGQTSVTGAALPTLTASYTGFVNGDTSNSLTTQPSLSTTATTSSPVGTYSITAGGAVDPDYSISYVAGNLTVTPSITTGTVYLDLNASGMRDEGEPGLAGRVVFLDLNHDGTLDAGDPTATTDADGNFTLNNNTAGTGPVLEATDQDTSDRYVVDQAVTNIDGTVAIGVVPISPIAPVPVIPDPFSATPSSDANTAYVDSLYLAVLGRVGGVDEVGGWLVRMNAGMTDPEVAFHFENSMEHRQVQVQSYYEDFLHRAPDSTSVGWVDDLMAGVSEETIVEDFLNSTEYQAAHQDSTTFIDDLYTDVLGRQGDTSGVAGWQARLTSGLSREMIVNDFVESTEADNQIVVSDYTAFLHRQPEQGAAEMWVNMLEAPDGSATRVAVDILAGPEFDQDAMTVQA